MISLHDDDLTFHVRFALMRQGSADAVVNGLTFVNAKNSTELEKMLTSEFNADANVREREDIIAC